MRGGNGKADDFSPHKTADGRELSIAKSSKSKTGYWCVIGPRYGKFYVKKKLDGEKGSKRSKVFAGHASAREAAIALAEYRDDPYELPEAPPRKPWGSSDRAVRNGILRKEARLEHLMAEANTLLGVDFAGAGPKNLDKIAAEDAEREAYAAWKEQRARSLSGQRVAARPEPQPRAALFDAAVLQCAAQPMAMPMAGVPGAM